MPARAGYRFVPFGGRINPPAPPVALEELRLDRPHEEGSVSGTLELTWVAETPVCIGVQGARGQVEPFEIEGRGCLPGASLRGMLRSVMEIAGFCHLGPINDHRHFGFRNFADRDNYRSRVKANNIKAGWLAYNSGEWRLTVAVAGGAFYPVDFNSLLGYMGNPVAHDEWRRMTIGEKRSWLACTVPDLLKELHFAEGATYYESIRRGKFVNGGTPPASGASGSRKRGYLVVGSKADSTANRNNEVFVGPPSPSGNDKHVLAAEFMALFNRINSNPGRERPEPTGSWRYWLSHKAPCSSFWTPGGSNPAPLTLCGLPGIPVFFCGNPADASKTQTYDPKTSNFAMGLSRVIKIPYREGVGDVAARLYEGNSPYRVPKLKDGFDLARAIFGWLDEAEDDEQAEALAGRVAFSPAFSEGEPRRSPPQEFVFGAPRESFYPFYLRGDYHGNGGVPVGRKRYPVRSSQTTPNVPNDNPDTKTCVKFHASGTSYRERIRVHNLHPIELCALVWCLTFGKVTGPWRHVIGRAKGFGYGRVRLENFKWARAPKIVGELTRPRVTTSVENGEWDRLSAEFEEWMDGRLGRAFASSDSIRRLRAYADPTIGSRHAGNLTYPAVEKFKNLNGPVDDGENWTA